MKRIGAIFLVMILILISLIGCDEAGSGDGKDNDYHIGVILYGKEDTLGSIVYSDLNHAADVLGVELTWVLGDYDANAQLASAENLVTSGVDGIIMLPLSEISTQKISALCEENEIYFTIMFRTINDPAIREEVLARDYYLGNSTGAEAENAKELVRIMSEAGKKNAAYIYAAPGTSNALRNDGFKEASKEYGINQLAETTMPTDGNLAVVGSTIQNFINTNADLDCIISSAAAGGVGETIISTLSQMNVKGEISIATFDVFEGVREAFEEGYLSAACGGQTPQATIMFMILYNAIDGNRLSEEPVELYQKFIFLKELEDCEPYEEYVVNVDYRAFTEEDILNMVVRNNAEFDMGDIEQMMNDYSLESVVEKAEAR